MCVCLLLIIKIFYVAIFYVLVYILRLHFSSVVPPMIDADSIATHIM